MMKNNDFTAGPILSRMIRFMLPVLFAMFLQATYGAVDLFVVGQFAESADVSAVSTGSQIVMTLTNLVVSFAMGITVDVARKIGQKNPEAAGKTISTGLILFTVIGLLFTLFGLFAAKPFALLMNAPEAALTKTVAYTRICGGGFLVISAYNLLGSIFRGLGDSRTPLLAVGIACAMNVALDFLFVEGVGMGAEGAAVATVLAQLVSVLVSLIFIRRQTLPFTLTKRSIRYDRGSARAIVRIGFPIALEDFLVGASFLVLLAIVNKMGLEQSAGVGVAEKVCAFIMLVPSAFMQSMSSFVAQNMGAKRPDRAKKALFYGIAVSVAFGVAMFFFTFFRGDLAARIFSKDPAAVANGFEYLKAYAIDCLFTCFLFCFIGYFNGIQKTGFVMAQGIIGAFGIRIPVAFLMQRFGGGSLFLIGLSTPCSTVVQITMCFIALLVYRKREKRNTV